MIRERITGVAGCIRAAVIRLIVARVHGAGRESAIGRRRSETLLEIRLETVSIEEVRRARAQRGGSGQGIARAEVHLGVSTEASEGRAVEARDVGT